MPAACLPGPASDEEVPAYLRALGVPALADVHVHFMPDSVQRKVWAYFDEAATNYGVSWPIHYRLDETARVDRLRALGLTALPALFYAHRPGMAQWLNAWGADFAARVPGAVHCATFYPEPGVTAYLRQALDDGARLLKVHLTVGDFAADDERLDGAWALLAERGTPVVLHAGSGPRPGRFTGPQGVARVLARWPGLRLVIAHLGMPEYDAFADLAQRHPNVLLDTTMVGTDFVEALAPMPPDLPARLARLADRVVLGSDFPSIPYPYAHQLQALARLGLGEDWMRQVLWHNGSALLGLDAPA